jgi:hypothetical protein
MAITIESLMESMREMIVKNAVEACAAMYGFSSVEALTRLDKSGNVVVVKEIEEINIQKKKVKVSKEENEARSEIKRDKEAKKVAELAEKKALKEVKLAEKKALKEVELAEKKALKDGIQAEKDAKKEEKKAPKKQKKFVEESISSTIIMSSDEEEIVINFANVDLINEIKKIRDIAYPYRLSNGVKLARQILDI